MRKTSSLYVPKIWYDLPSEFMKGRLGEIETLAIKKEECTEFPDNIEFFFDTTKKLEDAIDIRDELAFVSQVYV